MSVDPLAPDFPQWSPYVFSGNLVTVSKELEGMEPKFMIEDNGKLTSGMVSLLNSAYGYSSSSLEHTTWVAGSDTRVSLWYESMGSPEATTKGTSVAHDEGYNNGKGRNDKDWFGLIAHEQSHREDVENDGVFSFYGKYALQGVTGYKNIDTEEKAFENGSDDGNPNDLADQLWAYNGKEAIGIFKNGGLTNNQKASMLQSTGARFRRDVVLKGRISSAKSSLANIKKEMAKLGKMTAGTQKFFNRYINHYNKVVEDSTDEQYEITNTYGH